MFVPDEDLAVFVYALVDVALAESTRFESKWPMPGLPCIPTWASTTAV